MSRHKIPAHIVPSPADLIRQTRAAELERQARHLFEHDSFDRDRRDYRTFDAMPAGLQEWWRDRAARRMAESAAT